MSAEAAQAFRQYVNGNPTLEKEVQSCFWENGSVNVAALIALGQKHGYLFDATDVDVLLAANDDELSDFEAELVAAGAPSDCGSAPPHT